MADESEQEDMEKVVSILVFTPRLQFDSYGMSLNTASLVQNLRLADPEAKKIRITCAILQEEGKISEDQRKVAEEYKVVLKGALQPRGKSRKPKLKWLDEDVVKYYHYILKKQSFDYIIGHAPYLANGCGNLKSICRNDPKLILMMHDLPKTTDGDTDDDVLDTWLSDVDIIFSIGKPIYDEIEAQIRGLDKDERPDHKLYIPLYPIELLGIDRDCNGPLISGTQNVMIMYRENKHMYTDDLNLSLAVVASFTAAKHIHHFDKVRMNFNLLVANDEEKVPCKETLAAILRQNGFKPNGL